MRWRRWTSGLRVVALIALLPASHASPIDPAWIDGFWDDGDHDTVVILITSMVSAADTNIVVALVSLLDVTAVATLKPEFSSARTFSPPASRAPPIHA
jgi:hypothetical protein